MALLCPEHFAHLQLTLPGQRCASRRRLALSILSLLLISLPRRGFDLGSEQPDRPRSVCVSS